MPFSAKRLTLAIAASVGLAGCNGTVKKPSWSNPGNTATQRYEAIYHDPYPLNDVAPEIVGGRPREYQTAVPEVKRSRLFSPPQMVAPPR
ncbi:membrane or secreted protein [Botrimarina hoheduenensis]|uniref:Membrane or secreted protein n=1 Tax=Botrimarina hoheduenensis TaxID=2528000 RepID=A0A5C5VVG0_9BACT|nr:membrane or secreted protein [Botrimarina hoheduenensis]TWT41581.1 hypothetical protein Pla111_29580 [Botrimarina hoheduenensis]